jgi:hypothetical protein
MVGLSDKLAEYPIRLSGGQQQRVAITRALAMYPKIMLFEEITSALDPELVGEVLAAVQQLFIRLDNVASRRPCADGHARGRYVRTCRCELRRTRLYRLGPFPPPPPPPSPVRSAQPAETRSCISAP